MVDLELGLTKGGPTWGELLGSNNWEELMDPLNNDLRRLVIRCGDLCQVTYDTFINDPTSDYCGFSRYKKEDLLRKTAFPGGSDRYEVVGFLYGTACVSVHEALLIKSLSRLSRESWDKESNWIGFIAVTNDKASKEVGRREVYVVWRGTTRHYKWVNNLGFSHQSLKPLLPEFTYGKETATSLKYHHEHPLDPNESADNEAEYHHLEPKVMKGWLTIYTAENTKSPFTKLSARAQFLSKIKDLLDQYKNEDLSIVLTGHSLGATLSVLSAFDIVENLKTDIPVSAIVYACPKVGSQLFKERLEAHPNLKVLHIRNTVDLIPHYPPAVMRYVHVGTELEIDTRKSHYLKESNNPSDWHNLQAMIHVVNGWHGIKSEFVLKVKRSLALVNKSCDYLTEECSVPPCWWVVKNKGMVKNEEGEWVLARPIPEF
ncbi:phospholipase A1-IIdelta-like [Silene latifolia]|uniref:phospholipase A1-IIdelta-like n=1 Tax=Silene latifolia TaxID=37657 RepID=UPI003D788EC3